MSAETTPREHPLGDHIYAPRLTTLVDKRRETADTWTFKLEFKDEAVKAGWSFKAGQFAIYSAFGHGECAFAIASPPTRDYVECTFRIVGRVTQALADLEPGATVGVRGPYGNYFPLEDWRGKNLVFVAGGIGLTPARCVIWNVIDRRDEFGDVTVCYGARSVGDLVYKAELGEWENRPDVKLVKTVDPGGETPEWDGVVGFVPTVLEEAAPSAADAIALVCGPPIMIKFAVESLLKLGFDAERVYTTLESRMKCGVGKCGRCNVGPVYVCKEGPVFRASEVLKLPAEEL